ncbi:MAG TPA: bacteriocin fulvocin C-related protein, partial [Thermoanaerobaculia bacterium]|nr:bacteriocin fulvocin C-related protein [Thermoanaerobaculia bacterium]
VFEGLGLVQSGIMEVDPSSAEWRNRTLLAAHDLEARARRNGSRLLIDAFTQLGGPEIVYPSRARGLRSDFLPGDDCECNTQHDFCCFGDCPTSTTPNCHRSSRPWCIPSHGCGLFFLDDCNGVCGS